MDMLGWFKHWNGSDWMPKGIAKKFGAPAALAGLLSYGVVSGSQPSSVQYLVPQTPPPECGLVCKSKQWVNRHPAITGLAVGCAAGSWVPVVGTIVGCATGATVGYTIGSDERAARQEEKIG